MPFTPMPDKSAGDGFTELMWDILAEDFNHCAWRPLGDTGHLVSAASSIQFTSIDQGSGGHLLLTITARGDAAVATEILDIQINGDTGANYDYQYLQGANATVTSGSAVGQNQVTVPGIPGASATADRFGDLNIWIPDYTSARKKSFFCDNGRIYNDTTTNFINQLRGGWWDSTAAITQIDVTLNTSNNFAAGTRATLYWIGTAA